MVYLNAHYSVLWGFMGYESQCFFFTTIGP